MPVADAEGFNVHRRQHRSIRFGENVEVRWSPQAVARRKRYAGELGKPQSLQVKVQESTEDGEPRPWWEMDWASSLPLNENGVSYQAYYSGVGKARHTGKDLTEVRRPDKVGLDDCEQTSLRGIAIKAEANGKHRFQDLYRCLNASFLFQCWEDLNKDAASEVDKVTAGEGSARLSPGTFLIGP